MINKDLTKANIYMMRAKLLQEHAEIFKKARALEQAEAVLGTLKDFGSNTDFDNDYVEKKFKESDLESCLIKE